MGVVREIIETIDFYSPPLKRHRYSYDDVSRRKYVSSGTGSGLLFDEIHRREAAASGLLQQETDKSKYEDESSPEGSQEICQDPSEPEQAPKRRFRTIKKIGDLLYDDTAEMMGQLEDEAYELLNEDGYYDEILPIDADEDFEESEGLPVVGIIVSSALLILLIAFGIWYLKYIF